MGLAPAVPEELNDGISCDQSAYETRPGTRSRGHRFEFGPVELAVHHNLHAEDALVEVECALEIRDLE